jgi:rSAM/selenodomain-associated transferase 2
MITPLPLSIVVPTLDAAASLPATLASLAAGEGAIGYEIIVADGGSSDATVAIGGAAGRVVTAPRGRGSQLAAGAAAARGEWLLFLHADTRLGGGWGEEVRGFIADAAARDRWAAFRFALDDASPAARRLERMVEWRNRALGLPYGDQGLLVQRTTYARVGGFRPLPLMEDVDLVRRLGRARFALLTATATTSAVRYRRAGYLRRSAWNLVCLGLYFLGVPPRILAWLYR